MTTSQRPNPNDSQTSPRHQETIELTSVDRSAQTRANDTSNSDAPEASGSIGFEPGQTVDRYEVVRELGRGGMGSVHLARDKQLDRMVALKLPRIEGDRATVIDRFFREARAAAKFTHPNICPIFDVGEHEGRPFLAMGYVEGRPLSDYVESGKQQAPRQVAKVVRSVALALHEAHARGILHRDLKPANIMIDNRGQPIVMDFGLACQFDDDAQTRLTQQGTIIGTPAYMSPEQIEGGDSEQREIGPASDIYSLGVVMYELLTSRCPFEGSMISVIGQVMHKAPRPIQELRDDVPEAVVAICNHAMEKDPGKRFATMREFAEALSAYLKGTSSGADTTLGALQTPSAPQTLSAPQASPAAQDSSAPQPDPLFDVDPLAAELPPAQHLAQQPSPWSAESKPKRRQSGPQLLVIGGAGAGVAVLLLAAVVATWLLIPPARSEPDASNSGLGTAAVTESEGNDRDRNTGGPAGGGRVGPAARLNRKPGKPPRTGSASTQGSRNLGASVGASGEGTEGRGRPKLDGSRLGGRRMGMGAAGAIDRQDVVGRFHASDHDQNGVIDNTEMPFHVIMRGDVNQDGALSLQEAKEAYKRLHEKLFAPPSDAERKQMKQRDLPFRPRPGPRPRPRQFP